MLILTVVVMIAADFSYLTDFFGHLHYIILSAYYPILIHLNLI